MPRRRSKRVEIEDEDDDNSASEEVTQVQTSSTSRNKRRRQRDAENLSDDDSNSDGSDLPAPTQYDKVESAEWDPNQPESDRKQIRQQMRALINKLEDNRDNILDAGSGIDKLEALTKIGDKIYSKVAGIPEAAIDSQFAYLASSIGVEKAQSLSKNMRRYEAKQFVAKAGRYLSTNAQADVDNVAQQDWRGLGQMALSFFRRAQGFETMYGPLVIEPKAVKERKKPAARDVVEAMKRPDVIEDTNAGEQDELQTGKRVQVVANALWKVHKHRAKKNEEIEFFEFIVNPNSYAQTVENLFHLSFLVKQGRAKTWVSDDGRLLLAPVTSPGDNVNEQGHVATQQNVVNMSIELWERIVKDLVLTQSMIKTRQAVTSADYLPPSKQAQEDNDDDDDNDVEDKSVKRKTTVGRKRTSKKRRVRDDSDDEPSEFTDKALNDDDDKENSDVDQLATPSN